MRSLRTHFSPDIPHVIELEGLPDLYSQECTKNESLNVEQDQQEDEYGFYYLDNNQTGEYNSSFHIKN